MPRIFRSSNPVLGDKFSPARLRSVKPRRCSALALSIRTTNATDNAIAIIIDATKNRFFSAHQIRISRGTFHGLPQTNTRLLPIVRHGMWCFEKSSGLQMAVRRLWPETLAVLRSIAHNAKAQRGAYFPCSLGLLPLCCDPPVSPSGREPSARKKLTPNSGCPGASCASEQESFPWHTPQRTKPK